VFSSRNLDHKGKKAAKHYNRTILSIKHFIAVKKEKNFAYFSLQTLIICLRTQIP